MELSQLLEGGLTVAVCSQHWSAPVEQVWRASSAVGVATARRGVATTARAMAREKIMLFCELGMLERGLVGRVDGSTCRIALSPAPFYTPLDEATRTSL